MKIEKLKQEMNEEYNKYEKKIKPLRNKIKNIEKEKLIKIFEKNKGIIFKRSYGKNYVVLKVLKSINNKERLVYNEITIEQKEDYSINYVKEREIVNKKEAENIFEEAIK